MPAKVLVTPGSMPVLRSAVMPAPAKSSASVICSRYASSIVLVLRLAGGHVEIRGAALQAGAHDRHVELGDHRVDDQLRALTGLGDGVNVATHR